jgi:hypothetical protein
VSPKRAERLKNQFLKPDDMLLKAHVLLPSQDFFDRINETLAQDYAQKLQLFQQDTRGRLAAPKAYDFARMRLLVGCVSTAAKIHPSVRMNDNWLLSRAS